MRPGASSTRSTTPRRTCSWRTPPGTPWWSRKWKKCPRSCVPPPRRFLALPSSFWRRFCTGLSGTLTCRSTRSPRRRRSPSASRATPPSPPSRGPSSWPRWAGSASSSSGSCRGLDSTFGCRPSPWCTTRPLISHSRPRRTGTPCRHSSAAPCTASTPSGWRSSASTSTCMSLTTCRRGFLTTGCARPTRPSARSSASTSTRRSSPGSSSGCS
mmetsp:Transcript_13240/g.33410  ORF Transcript_13240/g.33410 Transcript_13240/m.33410 type:complete len:213 (-) Transcript_13240:682-1320(-)